MKKIATALLLLCIAACADSQNRVTEFNFKFLPLASLNLDRPTLQGSLEILHYKFGIEFGYGRRFRDYGFFNSDVDEPEVNFSGENYRFELKYFRTNAEDSVRCCKNFWAAGFWTINDLYNAQVCFRSEPGVRKIDEYAVKKRVRVIMIQYGWINSKGKCGTEFCAGVGVRRKIQSLIGNEFDPSEIQEESPFHGNKPFNGYLLHLNFTAKFNFCLFRSK